MREPTQKHSPSLNEAYFQSLIEDALDIITVTDRLGTIQYASPSNLRILGYTPDELIGTNSFLLVHPDDRLRCLREWGGGLLRPGTPVVIQFRYRHKNGTWRTLESIGKYINDASGPPRCILNSRDITDQNDFQRRMLQSEKMSAVGQLAAGVAHEINNPLAVILGFVQGLLHRTKSDDPTLAPLQAIEREAIRCKNLVQDLLTFSRERKPGRMEEAVAPMMNEALSLVETQARLKKVMLHRNFEKDLRSIWIDRNQVQQVVINLCTNALDAMPNGGDLTIHVSTPENQLEIRVTDTGTGIPEDIQHKILEPFFTTKEVGKGTGLGLSLVYNIVAKHQGHLNFETTPGKGTTFIVRLPIAPSKTNDSSTNPQAA